MMLEFHQKKYMMLEFYVIYIAREYDHVRIQDYSIFYHNQLIFKLEFVYLI